jgi:hypothetical protein
MGANILLFVGGFLVVAAFIVLGFWWQRSRAITLIDNWAQQNGFTIISRERRFFRLGPFFWTTARGQEVWHVTVVDPDNQNRSGWVRCGSWFLGLMSDKTEVRWEQPD